jgi:hypothetical protein
MQSLEIECDYFTVISTSIEKPDRGKRSNCG